jgi:hypothetical protein
MFYTADDAHEYIRQHDADVKQWNRQSKATLAAIVREHADGTWIVGGPQAWSKDELINRLADDKYPLANEARTRMYEDRLDVEERWTHASRGDDED